MTMSLPVTRDLKKHVGAIHVSGKLSLLKRKVANVLLHNAYDELLTKDEHSISLQELSDKTGFNSKDVELLKDAFRALAKTTVEWNILSEDGSEEWTITSLLSRATLKKGRGVCYYAYDRELSKKLYHPEMYARINLSIQQRFRSGHALTLYENCLRFKGVQTTGWIALEDWRRLFGVEPHQYKLFKDFSKRVLKPSISEVNTESDIIVESEFRKRSRVVTHIRFKVSDQVEHKAPSCSINEKATATDELMSFGVTRTIADQLEKRVDTEQIRRNIGYVKKFASKGNVIKNMAGFLVKAIHEDYASAAEVAKHHESKAMAAERAQQYQEEKASADRAAANQREEERLESLFYALTKEEQKNIVSSVLDGLSPQDMLAREYKKNGLDSVFVFKAVLSKLNEH